MEVFHPFLPHDKRIADFLAKFDVAIDTKHSLTFNNLQIFVRTLNLFG